MRFSVSGFCLCRHIADGKVAKMTTLTDEERQRLCEWLRDYGDGPLIWEAANEIERLAAEVERLTTIMSGRYSNWGRRCHGGVDSE
jgi:hypothetical protein